MEVNGVSNIFIARMASEEFSTAWKEKAKKRRLEGMGDWEDLALRTVLVDPPRAGLDPAVSSAAPHTAALCTKYYTLCKVLHCAKCRRVRALTLR